MKKKIGLGIAMAILIGSAHAGKTQPAPVEVDLTTGTALGDQVSARYSSNANEFIGCGVRRIRNSLGEHFTFGFCQAEDAAGEAILCETEDATLLDIISSSGDFGFITFSWDLTTLECRRIGFSNQSFYLPTKLGRN